VSQKTLFCHAIDMGANRPWLFALFFTGSPINQCLSLHSTRFSCRACCSLFPFISNDSQSIPATPCNMDATWPGQDFAVCRLALGALPRGDVGLPPKRTCAAQTGMSAFGQKRTLAAQNKSRSKRLFENSLHAAGNVQQTGARQPLFCILPDMFRNE
jgi:hypothetical protein